MPGDAKPGTQPALHWAWAVAAALKKTTSVTNANVAGRSHVQNAVTTRRALFRSEANAKGGAIGVGGAMERMRIVLVLGESEHNTPDQLPVQGNFGQDRP